MVSLIVAAGFSLRQVPPQAKACGYRNRPMSDQQPFYADLLQGFPVIVVQPVVWGEMDAYQHVNNVVYFRYFENARLAYVERLRWPEFEKITGIGPILAATQARFKRALT